MSGPQLGANVGEPDKPVDLDKLTAAPHERYPDPTAPELRERDRRRQLAALLDLPTDSPQVDRALGVPVTPPAAPIDAQPVTTPSALVDRTRDGVVFNDPHGYAGRVFELPAPDGIEPDGRARWEGPTMPYAGSHVPAWRVIREPDGRVSCDPGSPLFAAVDRERATAFAMAVLTACGPAPTRAKGDRS